MTYSPSTYSPQASVWARVAPRRPLSPRSYQIRLGQAILALREEAGLSQEQLGFECGLDRTYISGIERGLRNPTIRSLLTLTRALNSSPAEALARVEERR